MLVHVKKEGQFEQVLAERQDGQWFTRTIKWSKLNTSITHPGRWTPLFDAPTKALLATYRQRDREIKLPITPRIINTTSKGHPNEQQTP